MGLPSDRSTDTAGRRPSDPVELAAPRGDDTSLQERCHRDKPMAQTGKALQEGAQDAPALPHGDNTPQPVRTLRDWLDHLAARDRLAVVKPGTGLRFELAADRQAARRPARDAVSASGRTPDPGRLRPRIRSRLDGRGDGGGAGRGARALPGCRAAIRCRGGRSQAAPAQEVVHRHVDLARLLPLPTHNEHDSGPYISAGLMIARNPRTGKQNVSIHRCQLSGPNRLGVLLLPRHTHMFFEHGGAGGTAARRRHRGRRRSADAARLAGDRADRSRRAGDRRRAARRPLPVVKCLTSDIRVPAEAEIVIEGRFLPGVREPEGPFGEFPQYYGDRAPSAT